MTKGSAALARTVYDGLDCGCSGVHGLKVTICHVPPGNPSNPQTIDISCNGLHGHENHSDDYCGECRAAAPTGPCPSCATTGKMILCHRPPGNPSNGETLEVSCNAANGHENHPEDSFCEPCSGGSPAGLGITPTPTATVGGNGPTPTPTQDAETRDVCPNLAGFQGRVPDGYQVVDGQCVVPGCEDSSLDVPLNTYGFTTTTQLPNGDLFLLGSFLNLRLTSATVKNGTMFSGDPSGFGPRITPLMPKLGGFKISKPNTSLSAVSCQDNFRNLSFFIASQGVTDGDTIRLSLQNTDSSDTQLLASFEARGNGVALTQLHSTASLFVNNRVAVGTTGRLASGAFIPSGIGLTGGALRTEQLTLELRGASDSQLERCAQLVVDITRSSATGELSFAFTDITVNRINRFGDTSNPGQGLLQGLTGGFPTDMPCGAVCPLCAFAAPSTSRSCSSMCFSSPEYFLMHPDQLPTGTVLIGGVNFNVPVNIQTMRQDVLFALQGGFGMMSPLQQLNRGFVAAQLTWQRQGFLASAGVLRLQLNCLNPSLLPVTLSNGTTLTSQNTLGDLFEQAKLSIINQRAADMLVLARLFDGLNNSDAFGLCH